VASFSSSGPTSDGRIKPDLVAPGYTTISSKSAGYSATPSCSVFADQGTSMATPAAAGSALLVQPYLLLYFYYFLKLSFIFKNFFF